MGGNEKPGLQRLKCRTIVSIYDRSRIFPLQWQTENKQTVCLKLDFHWKSGCRTILLFEAAGIEEVFGYIIGPFNTGLYTNIFTVDTSETKGKQSRGLSDNIFESAFSLRMI